MINRVGLHRFESTDIFGNLSGVRKVITNAVKGTVSNGNWFAFCKKMSDSQVDIMSIKNSDGVSFGTFLANEYSESMYRIGVYKYLMVEFLCYYEAPTVIRMRDTNAAKSSYNKAIVTSNISVIAEWLGVSIDEARAKYGYRVDDALLDNDSVDFPYVKLYTAKDGTRKVTNPRKDLDLSIAGTRVIPMFALKEGVDALFELASQDFYDVDFLKDGGASRTINITFNLGKLRSVYQDEGKLREQYAQQYKGEFMESKNLERGYIRVIEVGTNIDNGATRSINYARITGFRKAAPDLTYLNIDLESVVDTFKECLEGSKYNVSEIVEMLDMFNVGDDRNYGGKPIKNMMELINWVDSKAMLLSTPFIKQLSLFMIGNPQWFDGYTGKRKVYTGDTGSSSGEGFDIGDIDDLDLI